MRCNPTKMDIKEREMQIFPLIHIQLTYYPHAIHNFLFHNVRENTVIESAKDFFKLEPMKQLVLIRHAKSEESNAATKDFDRSLNPRGFSDAPKMGLRLREHGEHPQFVISSPAERARLTAEFVLEQVGFATENIHWEEEVYEASARILMHVVNNISEEYDTVWMFGHNPGFTYLAEYLTGEAIGNIPTCGVYAMTFEVGSWAEVSQHTATRKFYMYPKEESEQ
jgi:phosphohistidine phosphatase